MSTTTAYTPKPKPKMGGGHFKFPGYLKFEFQDIDDPHFGKCTGMSGEIPFLTPTEPFFERLEYMEKHPKEIEELTWGMVQRYRDFWNEDTDEEIYQKLEVTQRCVFVIVRKTLDHNIPQKIWMMDFIALMAPMDSIADDLLGTDAVGAGAGEGADFNYVDFCEKFRGPTVPDVETLPSGLAAFQRMLGVYKTLMDRCRAVAPNFDDEYGEMLGPEINSIIQSHFIFHNMELNKEGPKFTSTTLDAMWRQITGYAMVFHFVFIFHKIRLSPKIQRSRLFEITLQRANDLLVLFNAIIGLHRDCRMKQLDSPITLAVEYEGVSLQEAWDRNVQRIHDCYHDYRLAQQQLLKVFKDEEKEIRRYIEVLDEHVDGGLTGYLVHDRYGHRSELKVISTNSK